MQAAVRALSPRSYRLQATAAVTATHSDTMALEDAAAQPAPGQVDPAQAVAAPSAVPAAAAAPAVAAAGGMIATPAHPHGVPPEVLAAALSALSTSEPAAGLAASWPEVAAFGRNLQRAEQQLTGCTHQQTLLMQQMAAIGQQVAAASQQLAVAMQQHTAALQAVRAAPSPAPTPEQQAAIDLAIEQAALRMDVRRQALCTTRNNKRWAVMLPHDKLAAYAQLLSAMLQASGLEAASAEELSAFPPDDAAMDVDSDSDSEDARRSHKKKRGAGAGSGPSGGAVNAVAPQPPPVNANRDACERHGRCNYCHQPFSQGHKVQQTNGTYKCPNTKYNPATCPCPVCVSAGKRGA